MSPSLFVLFGHVVFAVSKAPIASLERSSATMLFMLMLVLIMVQQQ